MKQSQTRLLALSENDNVLIALGTLEVGPSQTSDNVVVNTDTPVTLGHKIARCDIPKGSEIIKYGVSIGLATTSIKTGQHVHVHNMKSDYTPTYSLRETAVGSQTQKGGS